MYMMYILEMLCWINTQAIASPCCIRIVLILITTTDAGGRAIHSGRLCNLSFTHVLVIAYQVGHGLLRCYETIQSIIDHYLQSSTAGYPDPNSPALHHHVFLNLHYLYCSRTNNHIRFSLHIQSCPAHAFYKQAVINPNSQPSYISNRIFLHSFMQGQNLNAIMSNALQYKQKYQFKLIKQLKFKNVHYRQGDDIILNFDHNRDTYAKIVNIATIKTIQFPVLQVAWYLNLDDQEVQDQGFTHLDRRGELIFSQYTDWQYVEALKGKIPMVSFEQYILMDSKERELLKLKYVRSYKLQNSPNFLNKMPDPVCTCLGHFNTAHVLQSCVLCGLRFHPGCSGNQDLCLICVNP